MKVKTADLIGLSLDWAVAECLGATRIQLYEYNGRRMIRVSLPEGIHAPWEPSRYWGQGGPIIDQELISVAHDDDDEGQWEAGQRVQLQSVFGFNGDNYSVGPTPLIAAMRCYVVSEFGDEVEIPDELMKQL